MPTKNAMQSGLVKTDKWIIEFYTKDSGIEPFKVLEISIDTLNELKFEFSTKELAIEYANKNKIEFEIIFPKERKIIKKSYSDNFTK